MMMIITLLSRNSTSILIQNVMLHCFMCAEFIASLKIDVLINIQRIQFGYGWGFIFIFYFTLCVSMATDSYTCETKKSNPHRFTFLTKCK